MKITGYITRPGRGMLNVECFGSFVVDVEAHILTPSCAACSRKLYRFVHVSPEGSMKIIRAVELSASRLFPESSWWLWDLPEGNTCNCIECLN